MPFKPYHSYVIETSHLAAFYTRTDPVTGVNPDGTVVF
jgi:hypothetical protein